MKKYLDGPHRYPILAFGLGFLITAAIFLPFMIYNRGLFIFLGDYNVQQIPFYRLAHEAVRSGNIFWNWHTDLGANFIGSYSFYLLFSPFFWLTLPFPNSFVPYLMAPLLILKTACAALTAYWYIQRFVRDKYYAVLGGLLYAFSGFMTFNIFFNHFHEVVVFFPLLLIALEELVQNDRRGFFAAMVALNCLVNYWFFIGEVVFVLLYVFVRMSVGDWGMTLRKFIAVAAESVMGLLLACFLLVPSLMAITDNPRTTTDNLLTGWLMWIYGYNQRLPSIIGSIFFPPELPSQPNFFPDQGAKWASLSAWLPLFSTCGVGAYLISKKNCFVKRLLWISLFMACIPVLNSAFVLFNNAYYARWFYMPILLMALATAVALEDREQFNFGSSIRWTVSITLFIALAVGLSPVMKEDKLSFGLAQYPARFWIYVGYTLLSLGLAALLIYFVKDQDRFKRLTTGVLAVLIAGFTWGYIAMGKDTPENDRWFIEIALGGKKQLNLPDEGFVRSDLYKSMDNLGMFWGLPNIQAFHSIIPGSTMKFYPEVGIKRDVSSKPPVSYAFLRPLLSVKWLFVATNQEEQMPMEGYSLYDTQLGYNIYQNDHYIPMGFAYDKAFSQDIYDTLGGENRVNYMLRAVHLDEEAAIRNADILELEHEFDFTYFDYENMTQEAENRRAMSAKSFTVHNRGFTATTSFDTERLMFFSVPYDKGWSATVNGEPALIERANIGFMAVRVPEGDAVVEFHYFPPGFKEGAILTLAGIAMLAVYFYMPRRNPKPAKIIHFPKVEEVDDRPKSVEELLQYISDLEKEEEEGEDPK